ncbi:helix-turn-helix domain-containing protein [Sphingomonas sp. 3-13AW]|uniref:helix-turn-helix domain-containing protein n=1 Tax=Sphingomonas sp. 3-13AW TaxID=3050450 RepID=UPI003BB5D2DF
MAATAARSRAMKTPAHLNLELDPIARGVVFPSHVRDVRRSKGYETLRDFDGKAKVGGTVITYNRLAKIERGEVIPDAAEITSIAKALKVPVDALLVDPTSPMFDRTAWARDHIEASLKNRGGDVEAMKLGAAMRVHRLSLKLSTSDLKEYGLPAATASRIENADRPLERWPRDVKNGIAQFFGESSFRKVEDRVQKMFEAGELTVMLAELFSEEAIQARNNRRLRSLLTQLPGTAAKKITEHLDEQYTKLPDILRTTARSRHLESMLSGSQDNDLMVRAGDAEAAPPAGGADVETKGTDDLPVLGARLLGNRITLDADTGAKIRRPSGVGADAYAVRVDVSSVGSRIQRGSVVVAEEGHKISGGDLVVIRDSYDNSVMLAEAVVDEGHTFFETQNPKSSISQADLTQDEVVAKVLAILMP